MSFVHIFSKSVHLGIHRLIWRRPRLVVLFRRRARLPFPPPSPSSSSKPVIASTYIHRLRLLCPGKMSWTGATAAAAFPLFVRRCRPPALTMVGVSVYLHSRTGRHETVSWVSLVGGADRARRSRSMYRDRVGRFTATSAAAPTIGVFRVIRTL